LLQLSGCQAVTITAFMQGQQCFQPGAGQYRFALLFVVPGKQYPGRGLQDVPETVQL